MPLRAHGFRGKVALTVHNAHDAWRLEQQHVDLVLRPFSAAADTTAEAMAAAIAVPNDRRH